MDACWEMRAEINIEGLDKINERLRKLEEVIGGLTKPPEQQWYNVNDAAKYFV
jgi:hypothetical protein